jgi:hypothetical protein
MIKRVKGENMKIFTTLMVVVNVTYRICSKNVRKRSTVLEYFPLQKLSKLDVFLIHLVLVR